ncbi:hypothetical protein [Actinoplanes utahensis]|uniref:Transmembrane protein n=1 Tax=Actinoplanes utahensis TaxID=1869 RepID=A0A0A6UEE7_ACTUT|nr:hypothetical protein [Actinoplanes utahensis]KHD73448.1 hypothetical protein MB27_35205 [Actinoplanes utahensis]GIF30236.1 hypothetical protein Aut01nite_32220 [Actinoplanes utahensis]
MENNAAEQLTAIADARSTVAGRLVTPGWYHPVLGAALAGYVTALGFGGDAAGLIAGMLFITTTLLLMKAYRERTGVWVSGFRGGRTGRWSFAMGGLVGAVLLGTWATTAYTDSRWPIGVLAVLAFAGTVLLGRGFDAALRAELRSAA